MTQAVDDQPLVLVETADLSRDEWLSYRRQGLGGSDAAAVLGISPFRTARDLYYDKRGLPIEDDESNWVAREVGNLLEDLVARIFSKKTGLKVYRRKCMFQHPRHPWMLADLDFLVEMPDGSTAILECKTTNYNARDKWEYDGKPIVPVYYETQGRHYMAVMGLSRVYFCCLYGNNEDEVIIRHIDRDMDYEAELIFLEEDFWLNNVQAQAEPPYIENDGELILESLHRLMGPSSKDAPPVVLTQTQSAKVLRYLEVRGEKLALDAQVRRLEAEMKRLKALIIADMGNSRAAAYENDSGSYTVTLSSSRREGIFKDDLLRLKEVHPEIYEEYASVSQSEKLSVKFAAAEAA